MNSDKKEKSEHIWLSDHSISNPNDMSVDEKEVWESMHFDFEVVDNPPGLKEDVLNFVFLEEAEYVTPLKKLKLVFQTIRSQFTPLTANLSIAMLVCIIILATQLNPNETKGFSEIAASMTLNSLEGDLSEINGQAFMINNNGKQELVISVTGFPQTEGKEVYQVWLIENGHRQSAGVFKPDPKGNGILTVSTSKFNKFDNIGITLEPDAEGKQPRGKKIVGT